MFSGNVDIELDPLHKLTAAEEPGTEMLSERELGQCRRFKTPKRRREWLGGRLAAKRLVRRWLGSAGSRLDLAQIEVCNHESGQPYIRLAPPLDAKGNIPLSISHSSRYAVAAVAGPGMRLGADVETIEKRGPAWVDLMAHESEHSPKLRRDMVGQTVLWTLKEAVLKTLGVGLSVPLQDVRFVPDASGFRITALGPMRLELHGKAKSLWEQLGHPAITLENVLMGGDSSLSVAYTPAAAGNAAGKEHDLSSGAWRIIPPGGAFRA